MKFAESSRKTTTLSSKSALNLGWIFTKWPCTCPCNKTNHHHLSVPSRSASNTRSLYTFINLAGASLARINCSHRKHLLTNNCDWSMIFFFDLRVKYRKDSYWKLRDNIQLLTAWARSFSKEYLRVSTPSTSSRATDTSNLFSIP